MKNRKHMIGILIALLLTATIISPSNGANKINQPLDVNGVKRAVLENSLSIKSLNNDVDLATYKLMKAKEGTTTNQGSIDSYKKLKNYYVNQATIELEYSNWLKTEKLQEIVLKGEELFWKSLLINKEIALSQEKMERLKKSKSNVQKKIDLGQEIASAMIDMDIMLKNEEGVLSGLLQKKNGYLMDLNVMMMQDMTAKLVLVSSSIPSVIFEGNINDSVTKALEKNGDYIKLLKEKDLLLLELLIYDEYGSGLEYQDAKTEVVYNSNKNAIDLQNAKYDIEYEIRSQYNVMLNALDNITIAQLTRDGLNLDVNAAKKRLELGLTTLEATEILHEQLKTAELNLEVAQLEYYIKVLQLENLID